METSFNQNSLKADVSFVFKYLVTRGTFDRASVHMFFKLADSDRRPPTLNFQSNNNVLDDAELFVLLGSRHGGRTPAVARFTLPHAGRGVVLQMCALALKSTAIIYNFRCNGRLLLSEEMNGQSQKLQREAKINRMIETM